MESIRAGCPGQLRERAFEQQRRLNGLDISVLLIAGGERYGAGGNCDL